VELSHASLPGRVELQHRLTPHTAPWLVPAAASASVEGLDRFSPGCRSITWDGIPKFQFSGFAPTTVSTMPRTSRVRAWFLVLAFEFRIPGTFNREHSVSLSGCFSPPDWNRRLALPRFLAKCFEGAGEHSILEGPSIWCPPSTVPECWRSRGMLFE